MDDVALATMWTELARDCQAAAAAAATAPLGFAEGGVNGLAACGHFLSRFFNIVEQMSLRVAKAFENNIDDEKAWHAELIRRMTLEIPGVRPALFPTDVHQPLQELRQFRHIFNHAYDLELIPEKLQFLLHCLEAVAPRLHGLARQFIEGVGTMHGLTVPPE